MPITRLRPYHIAVIAAALYALGVVILFRHPLALVTPGSDFNANSEFIYTSEGYDGQFTYYIAESPLGAAPRIDVPAYRYQRILLPILGWALAFGQSALIPFTLLLVNMAMLGVGTFSLERLLIELRVSPWFALGYALSLGVFASARLSLTEPIAYGLCLWALWQLHREQFLSGTLLFALALFAKETAVIVAAGVGFHYLLNRQIGRAFLFGGIVLAPFLIWQGVLFAWLGAFGLGSGGAMATSFELIPFMGVARILIEGGPAIFAALMVYVAPFVIWPTLWGLWRCVQDIRAQRWTLYTSLLLFNSAIMLFVPFSTYREPLGILRFIVGLQIAVILYAAERKNRRALRFSTFWAVTSLIAIYSDWLIANA